MKPYKTYKGIAYEIDANNREYKIFFGEGNNFLMFSPYYGHRVLDCSSLKEVKKILYRMSIYRITKYIKEQQND